MTKETKSEHKTRVPKKGHIVKKIQKRAKKIHTKLQKTMHDEPEFASKVLMVEPTAFYLNEETLEDNKFMERVKASRKQSTKEAL